ncbi:MAG: desulfoferrodoxin [Desulfobulbus sp.]|nr:MAG: desulfoferrodoxin [Desulfobulbus sp.]RUM37138.1 MAG: desulfoferrodoxin [Desulfobulbus sp.]RUM41750.1 MAG: desulfoferrodoxin [Desulfobulbus sp.]
MIDRRDFLKTAVVTTSVAAMMSSGAAFADNQSFPGVVYTKKQPGQWAKKVGSHAPEVTVDGSKVMLVTRHGMSAEHYIVRHTLVLGDGTVVGATTFTAADKPESSYDLPANYKGVVYATSFCNKHDFWVTELSV